MLQAWGDTLNVCDAISKRFKPSPASPLKSVKADPSNPALVSEVVTGWIWDGAKGNLAGKIEAVAGIKAASELGKDALKDVAQLRVIGASSYRVVGNPVIKKGQPIVLTCETHRR